MVTRGMKIGLAVVLLVWALILAFGLRYYNGYWFFFDLPDRSDWTFENGERQYLDRHAGVVKDEVLTIDSETYYFDDDGYVYKGSIRLDGAYYYFHDETGVMLRAAENRENDVWYYYTKDGSRFDTGWQTLADGRMAYYDGENGMLFGEQTIDGAPYLLNISRGGRMIDTVYFDGQIYTIADDGVVQSKQTSPLWKGIDVSVHQNEIDWTAVKESGVQFAIVRAGYLAAEERPIFQADSRYAQNVLAAQEQGISVGAYLYLYNSTAEGLAEGVDAFHAYTIENRIRLDLPVFLDVEDKAYFKAGSDEQGGYDYRTALVRDRMEQLRALGYKSGFYTFQHWANHEFDAEGLFRAGYPFWLANWFGNDQELAPDTLSWNDDAQPSLWQYRATGQVGGIEGDVDMDYLYWARMGS